MNLFQAIAAALARMFSDAPAEAKPPGNSTDVIPAPDNLDKMASERFLFCLTEVLKHEGGYVDHPRDPGGATNLGVTIGTLSYHLGRPATKQEVRALTPAAVAPIYHKGYWMPVRGDALGPGLDLAVFDYAVNSGPGRAVKALQSEIGVEPDGRMGLVTLNALAGLTAQQVALRVCDRRRAFLRGIDTYPTFGRGWERRVNEVEAAVRAS